jgi:cytochrome b
LTKGNCCEIYGWDKDLQKVETYFDPVSGKPQKTKDRRLTPMDRTLQVLDPLVRSCHWSLALAFLANHFGNEEGGTWHRWLGDYAVAWLEVRFVWGLLVRGAAAWLDFWPTRERLQARLARLLRGGGIHRLGYSSLGALERILIMLSLLLRGVTGFMFEDIDCFVKPA